MSSQEISWPVTWQRLIWIFLVSLLKQINCLHSLSVSGFIDWKSGSRKTTDPLEMQLISSEWTLRQAPEIALWLRRVDRRWRRHFHFYALVGRWEINCLFLRADKNEIACSWQTSLTKNIKSKTYQPFKQSFDMRLHMKATLHQEFLTKSDLSLLVNFSSRSFLLHTFRLSF